MAKLYIQFYNIKDSTNRVEYGPYVSIYCDGVMITGVWAETEHEIAAYDEDMESYRVYQKSYPPFHFGYWEIVTKGKLSDVAGSLAKEAIKETLEKGGGLEIPSLGVNLAWGLTLCQED